MRIGKQCFARTALLGLWMALPATASEPIGSVSSGGRAVDRIVDALEEPTFREVVRDILERSPTVAAAEARARAALQRAPQVRALPDPVAGLTAFLASPETRTGPQVLSASIEQGLPWFGKLALKEQAALHAAAAMSAEVEAQRLSLVTEARRLLHELAFVDRYQEVTNEFLAHLVQHEEIARVRYSTGIGGGLGVVKLQAEITRLENRLLEIQTRRVGLAAELNKLRDREAGAPLPEPARAAAPKETRLDLDRLLEAALGARPELVAAESNITRAEILTRAAEKDYRPNFSVGLTYTAVDRRDDPPGRLQPPAGNGNDIVAIQGGITLPVWRRKLSAGVEEAVELQAAAQGAKRSAAAAIESSIGDLVQRVPLSWRQLRLVEDLLVVQAEEALESAQSGYVTGTLNALDLLDAEHVLFEAHTAVARAEADYLIGIAKLEGALGGPLHSIYEDGAN